MSPVLEIILKVLAIAIIILLAIGCIGAGLILCKWFTDDLNDYYAAQRDLKRWELECLKAPMHATLNNTIDDLHSFSAIGPAGGYYGGKMSLWGILSYF